MKLGIFGFENAGKSTVFDALTGSESGPDDKRETRLKVVPVPDPRLERLREDYKPKKFTPASVQYVDLPGFGGDAYFGELREIDALVGVVAGFSNASVMPRGDKVDWKRDLVDLGQELAIADFILCEKHAAKLKKLTRDATKATPRDKARLAVLEKVLPVLEDGGDIHSLTLSAEDKEAIRDFHLLSLKPRIMLVNVDDDTSPESLGLAAATDWAGEDRPPTITLAIAGRLEAEVSQLPEEDRAEFLADFNIKEVVADRLLRISYAYLNLISFLTAGDKEVRAWTIRRGNTAVEAAGKIHSDIARAFIRAEVTAWDDYAALGSIKAAKDAKKWRLEGRGYVIQDGDVIEIRHNA